jgi:iron(III) transport system substrate-binding protein
MRKFVLVTFPFFLFPLSFLRAGEVVLYTSIDEPVARPIIRAFEKSSGLRVILVTDAEATKSVGLAERVRAEKDRPQADVFWGNEPFLTINLAEEGLLDPYESPSARDIPDRFKDQKKHRWTGNGLRARVIAQATISSFIPQGLEDLTHPALKGRVAMARPTAGTTGGHVAALYALWGEARAKQYFRDLRKNGIKLLGGNSVVADTIGRGICFAGLTDNDDVASAKANDGMLTMILPDQKTFGTLLIPSTVGIIHGGPNPAAAKKLVDHLLSAGVEKQLLEAHFALASVRDVEKAKIKAMDINYRDVARIMPQAVREATAILEGRE